MDLQQQQQDPHTSELEEWQVDQSAIEQKPISVAYIVSVVTVIGVIILMATFISYRVAIALQDLPKIHLQPLQQALVQSIDRKATDKLPISKPSPQFSKILRTVSIRDFSPTILVQVEQVNSAHRGYQYSIRKFQFENAKIELSELSFRQFSKQSRMTYNNYLEALKAFRINTFPVRDSSQELKVLQKQTKQYFTQKYNLGRRLSENNICVVVELTKQGLQSGKYYYSLKSIFQQNYKNYKMIVINYPEMQQLKQVEDLLSTFQMKQRIVLLDKLETANKLQSSIFVYNSIKQHCKNSAMTMILKDTGELIGKQVFSIIDQTIYSHDPDLIITNYILESANPLRQKLSEKRYKISLASLYLNKPREMPYKTKYLKAIKTETLMALGEKPFRNADGGWINGLFQANLQFSTIQYSCGNVVQIQQILYKSSQKSEIENALQLFDAQSQPQQTCRTKQLKEKQIQMKKQSQTQQRITQLEKNHSKATDKIKQDKYKQVISQNPTQIQNNMKQQSNAIFSNQTARQINKTKNTTKYTPSVIQKPSFQLVSQILQQNVNSIFTRSIENLTEKQIQEFNIKFKKQTISRKIFYEKINEKHRSQNNSSRSDKSGISFKSLSQATNQLKLFTNNIVDTLTVSNITQIQQVEEQKKYEKNQINNNIFNKIEFCLVLTTQNNEKDFSHIYSIQSIIKQEYSSFRLFIIDNFSGDLTAKITKNYLSKMPKAKTQKIKLYKTKEKKFRSEIIHNSIKQFCNPNQVVITLNSGQLLINKNTLLQLKEEYDKTHALSIYSNSFSIINESAVIGPSTYPNYTIIQDKSIDKKMLFAYSLLSYRASIFYNIKLSDFKDKNGNWIEKGEDQIVSFGIQQLSCNSIYYFNQIHIFLPLPPQLKILQTNTNKYSCFSNIGKIQKDP